MSKQREAAMEALKAIRAEVTKSNALRFKARKEKKPEPEAPKQEAKKE